MGLVLAGILVVFGTPGFVVGLHSLARRGARVLVATVLGAVVTIVV
jgi:hypothetical protein